MTKKVEFLDNILNHRELKVNTKESEVISQWPRPQRFSEVRGFLGLAVFVRRLIKDFRKIAQPMFNLIRKNMSISMREQFCTDLMENRQQIQVASSALIRPEFTKPFRCHFYASQNAVRGTLTKSEDGDERVVACFTRKLNTAQPSYGENDTELLGMVELSTHFQCNLHGSEL